MRMFLGATAITKCGFISLVVVVPDLVKIEWHKITACNASIAKKLLDTSRRGR